MTTTRTHLLAAIAVAALTLPVATAEALPGADGAYPIKNTTYQGTGSVASVGYSAKVKIKVGKNTKKVEKLTIKIRCAEGKQKYVRKNLAIDDKGYIAWDQRWPVYFFGQFTTKHKVDRVSVKGDESRACSTYVVDLDVHD